MQNQPLNENQLQALLRLKRYEQPPAGYFNELLESVHRRQREELLRRPAWQIAIDRIRAFFAPLHLEWRHAGSMAALLVAGIFAIRIAIPERAAGPLQIANVGAKSSLPASSQTGPMLTLQPGSAPSFAVQENPRVQRDPDAPVRFIIDAKPVSYETTQIRF
ncbi:MAG: hypothetical protein ABI318_02420 [Chthoniobacteraceae bacterium]